MGGQCAELIDASSIIFLRARPEQGGIMTNSIQIGGGFRLAAKRRNRFPHGQQYFLEQIVAIVAGGETVDHMVHNRAVIAGPLQEALLLFVNIHEFSVI